MRPSAIATTLVVSLVVVWTTVAVRAHHSFAAEFDASKPVKLQGTVVKMEWINPHSWLTLAVKTPSGRAETWQIEAGAPNSMFRRGFNRNSLPVGTEIVVEGFRSRDGQRRANGRDLTFPDGRRLFLGSQNTPGAPPEGRNAR